jgi:TRAP-type C4-dicarboxylate transport system permease small subunit
MTRLIDLYCRMLNALNAALLLGILVLVFGNVVLRYGFNSGILISEELSRWLFVWLTFLGAIVALNDRSHLGTEMLVSRLGRIGRIVCFVIAQAGMLYVTWLLLLGSIAQAKINLDVPAPVSGIPVAVFYFSGIVFGVSALVLLGYGLVRLAAGRMGDDELVMVRESEDEAEPHAPAAPVFVENGR